MKTIEEMKKAVHEAEYWPDGSNLVHLEYGMVTICSFNQRRDQWRELAPAELDILRKIPEMAAYMEKKGV